jgi:hypothetical protein
VGRISLLEISPSALNLMGDWCRPTFRHRLMENRGALPKDHELGEKKKKRKNKILSVGEVFAS